MKTLYEALAKAQSEMGPVVKDKEMKIPGRKPYWYASLDSIKKTISKPLSDNSLFFSWDLTDGQVHVYVRHGEFKERLASCPVVGNWRSSQDMGKEISYAKRYALSMAFGLSTTDDIDAEENPEAQIVDRKLQAKKTQQKKASAQPAVSSNKPKQVKNFAPSFDDPPFPINEFEPTATVAEFNMPPHKGKSKKVKEPTKKQIGFLNAMAKDNGWSKDDLNQYVRNTYGKDNVQNLEAIPHDKSCEFQKVLDYVQANGPNTKKPFSPRDELDKALAGQE